MAWLPMAVVYAMAIQPSNGADFGMYYAAAETLRYAPRSDVYQLSTLSASVLAHGGCAPTLDWPYPYPYQPLLALLLEPLTWMPCQDAANIWRLFNFALWFGVSALYTIRAWRRHGPTLALIVALVTVTFLPTLSGIYYGQIHLAVLACIVAGIMLVEREHEYAGGAALALGAALKYFPAFIVFYYLLRGRWRVAGSAAIVSLALVAIEALVVGPQRLIESIGAGEHDVRYYAGVFQDGNWMYSLPGGVILPYLVGAAFLAIVAWLRWRRGAQAVNDHLGAGWALATMLMLSPLFWWFYLTWLLPTLMICLDVALRYARQSNLGRGWRSLARRWWPLATLMVAYGLFLVPQYNKGVANYRVSAAATLLLWLLCGALYLWSAGVRLPWWSLSLGAWRRSPVAVEPSSAGGVGSASL